MSAHGVSHPRTERGDAPGLTTARPPAQPATGPGGAAYAHAGVLTQRFGRGSQAYWLYQPLDPPPRQAPLVVFLHGWLCRHPGFYDLWLQHLTRRGSVVIYPEYQRTALARLTDVHRQACLAIGEAVAHLRQDLGEGVRTRQMVLVGHSLGGALAVDIAALAAQAGLPEPAAVMAVQPGRGEEARDPLPAIPLDAIPPRTLMLVVVGEDDRVAGSTEAERIFLATRTIPPSNKNFVLVRSDFRGTPPLIADHWSPLCASQAFREEARRVPPTTLRHRLPLFAQHLDRTANALHYFGYWKLCDALIDAALHGRNRRFALGDTPEQRFMGRWSHGEPVRGLGVGMEGGRRPHAGHTAGTGGGT